MLLCIHESLIFYLLLSAAIDCSSLHDPQNGKVFTFPDGKQAVYSCNPGYTMKTGTQFVQCVSGKWSSPPPTCELP